MKRLIRKAKLGRAPVSIADIKTVIRQKFDNPALLEAKIKDIIDEQSLFNDNEFQSKINAYNDNPNDLNLNNLINYLAPLINHAIDLRKQRSEQIIRDNKYNIKQTNNNVYEIINYDDSNKYTIDLTNETCTCPDYVRMGWFDLWCKHLYTAFLLKNNLDDLT